MILLEKLKDQGWYLTEEGVKKLVTINNLQTEDAKKIISVALDWDLRDIAGGALPSKPESNGTIPGHIILQLQKMRNISAPKANEESSTAPRFLQLELTDGINTIAALEFERIPGLNLNVPPGTKLYMKAEKLKLVNGFLALKPSDVQVLGGKVEALVEKWEVARQMLKYARSNRRISGSGAPPPWIAFGKRLDAHKDTLATDRNFKSLLAAGENDKNSKENDEFNASRSQAIAEAAKAGQKKVFGGGQQNILDHNVKKILEKGFSEEEAKHALRTTNNNLERALYNLKRRNNVTISASENNLKSTTVSAGGRIRDRGTIASSKEDAAASKPQANVSLFDFLTDKLPATISSSTNTVQNEPISGNANSERKSKNTNSVKAYSIKTSNAGNNRFENNMSSSFAANRATAPTIMKDMPVQSRPNTFNRKQEERNQQSGNKNGKNGERNRPKTQNENYNKTQNQTAQLHNDNVNLSGGNSNAKNNDKAFKKEREQTPRHSNSEYQTNKRSNDYNKVSERKSYQSRETNRNNSDSRTAIGNYHQKPENVEKDLDHLADTTSKLSIQSKKDSSSNAHINKGRNQTSASTKNHKPTLVQQKQKSDSYPDNSDHQEHSSHFANTHNSSSKSFQQNSKLGTYSPQLGNGFAYDPSKIIGFQSKEANEYAMNMLKSQGMIIQQLQHQQSPSSQTPSVASLPPITPQQHSQTQLLNQAPSSVAYIPQNPNIFVAQPQHVQTQIGMVSGENWPWKDGDLCLAKYWDDGNYYNAKITAISEKTCVVLFLGYGNHEEVLKSDCIPITDPQHIPLNAYPTNITPAAISQPSPPAFSQRSSMHSGGNGVGNQRYRSERQMYVPPPKRNNN